MQLGKHKLITIIRLMFGSVALAGCRAAGAAPASLAGVEPVYQSTEGLALKGYDAVAYFTEGKPIDGRSEFALNGRARSGISPAPATANCSSASRTSTRRLSLR